MVYILDTSSVRAVNGQRNDIVADKPNGFELRKCIFPLGRWQIAIWWVERMRANPAIENHGELVSLDPLVNLLADDMTGVNAMILQRLASDVPLIPKLAGQFGDQRYITSKPLQNHCIDACHIISKQIDQRVKRNQFAVILDCRISPHSFNPPNGYLPSS